MNVPTNEEIRMLKEYVLLPYVLTAFDRDAKQITAAVKTPGPYADTIQRAMDAITSDIVQLRSYFRASGIRVLDMKRTADGIQAKYVYRSHHSEFMMLTNLIRVEAELLMRRYLGEDVTRYIRKDLPGGLADFGDGSRTTLRANTS
ncbi:hypothetical protein [Paenibacillus cremeus]|uniref:Uncharacterized protein n=1 Tax=Paenibacillus cremeus TaxID=2163881 RepID=A0A559K8Q0_9BACL|nr:hypothetical protein [Paenibacillus cremeus]TVY08506.1 hypothetical protein FPZ49_17945 [Paenibacillus cremeus]